MCKVLGRLLNLRVLCAAGLQRLNILGLYPLLGPNLRFQRLALVFKDANAPADIDEDALGRLYLLKGGLRIVNEVVQVLHVQKVVASR